MNNKQSLFLNFLSSIKNTWGYIMIIPIIFIAGMSVSYYLTSIQHKTEISELKTLHNLELTRQLIDCSNQTSALKHKLDELKFSNAGNRK